MQLVVGSRGVSLRERCVHMRQNLGSFFLCLDAPLLKVLHGEWSTARIWGYLGTSWNNMLFIVLYHENDFSFLLVVDAGP